MADVDLGMSQNLTGDTSFRLDVSAFVFELPVESPVAAFSAGAKSPAMFYDTYLIGLIDFKEECNKMKFDQVKLGLGYPIEFGDFTIRSELRVATPEWANFSTWKFEPMIGLQLSFGALQPSE